MPKSSSNWMLSVSALLFLDFFSRVTGEYPRKKRQSPQRWLSSPGFKPAPRIMFVLPQWGHGTEFLSSFEDKIEWDAKLPLASLLMRLLSKSFTMK
jgi:hypothetical protein